MSSTSVAIPPPDFPESESEGEYSTSGSDTVYLEPSISPSNRPTSNTEDGEHHKPLPHEPIPSSSHFHHQSPIPKQLAVYIEDPSAALTVVDDGTEAVDSTYIT